MFSLSKFGERLRTVLEEKDMQGKELAKILSVEPPTVSNWLNGNRFPKDDMLIQIADYFNVSVDYLLGRTDFPRGIISQADIDGHHYEFELESSWINIPRTFFLCFGQQMVNNTKISSNT